MSNPKAGNGSGKSDGCVPILVVVGLILAAGAFWFSHRFYKNDAESQSNNEAQIDKHLAETKERNKPIVVKGLSIGMPIEDLPQTVKTHFVGWELYNGEKIRSASDFSITSVSRLGLDSVRVVCDQSRQVVYILFDPKAAELAFNASDMTGQQFAEQFANAYPIPALEPKGKFWEFYNAQNKVLVRIGTDKTVLLQKITNPDALKPQFN